MTNEISIDRAAIQPTEVLPHALWKVIPERTEDHWLELEDPEGWYAAIVRFDGCVHFHRYFNMPLNLRTNGERTTDVDYVHICELDEMIERLQALKAEALKHFGNTWPL